MTGDNTSMTRIVVVVGLGSIVSFALGYFTGPLFDYIIHWRTNVSNVFGGCIGVGVFIAVVAAQQLRRQYSRGQ